MTAGGGGVAGRTTIILDAEVLRAQIASLSEHGAMITRAASDAGSTMPGTAFGAMNGYLPGPINELAGQADALLSVVGQMFDRMRDGVDGIFTAFDTIEAEASAKIGELEP
ncbi:hypothetical protein [Microbacterium gorillae]|uniref:hypothetical protein n=1 Tax=Microbacterium gorillae TaxID=1231063 RepID=UPI003D99F373